MIYLDYNATTPVDPRVVDEVVPYLNDRFGNASSTHAYGFVAHEALERSRTQIATLINARRDEIVFTSGGSEGNNFVLKGIVFANLKRRPHIVTSAVEHPAILSTLRYLQRRFDVAHTIVPVDEYGVVSPAGVEEAIRPETVLITVMHANNEVGTIQPIREIAEVARHRGIPLHTDAAQTAGKIEVDVAGLGVDCLTLAAHKVYGPKGFGAVYLRSGLRIDQLIHGSGQEHGLRAGTENVASAVGMGKACELAHRDLTAEQSRLEQLRDVLHARLEEGIPGLRLNGHPTNRLPNTLNVSVPGVSGQSVLEHESEIAASTGSACHSGLTEPSPVLLQMGLSTERANGAIRLSLGRWSTRMEIERAAELLVRGFQMMSGTPEQNRVSG